MTELNVTRQDVGEGHIIYTRSDGEVFNLKWHDNGQASLTHEHTGLANGICFDVSIEDKPSAAVKRILDYPTDWPIYNVGLMVAKPGFEGAVSDLEKEREIHREAMLCNRSKDLEIAPTKRRRVMATGVVDERRNLSP